MASVVVTCLRVMYFFFYMFFMLRFTVHFTIVYFDLYIFTLKDFCTYSNYKVKVSNNLDLFAFVMPIVNQFIKTDMLLNCTHDEVSKFNEISLDFNSCKKLSLRKMFTPYYKLYNHCSACRSDSTL